MVETEVTEESVFLKVIICKEYFSSIFNYFLVLYQDSPPQETWYKSTRTYENIPQFNEI